MRFIIYCLVLLASVSPVWATTFSVEKDGTGDFTVIQDAVNVAASGDTIRIGPGRFNDGEIVTCPGWTQFVRVLVTQNELTIIGSGIGNTIIGQEQPWTIAQGVDRGITGGPHFGSYSLHVEGVSVENTHSGLISDPAFDLTVRSCSFSGHYLSIDVGGGGSLAVDNCSFDEVVSGGYAIGSVGGADANISNCSFHFSFPGPWSEVAIHLEGVPTSSIRNCEVIGGNSGAYCVSNSCVTIDNCVFTGQSLYGVVCTEVEEMDISNCIITNQANVGIHSRYSTVSINSTSFADVNLASISFNDYVSLSANSCILAHGPEYAVRQFRNCSKSENGDLPHLDFTNNDWGTANADSIEAWIKVCNFIVDYVPYVGQPVSTEQETWGGVKATYR